MQKGLKLLYSLFLSKNQKLVRRWRKEHGQIASLADEILGCCSNGNEKKARKKLKKLSSVTLNHLMDEDIELYKLLENHKKIDDEIKDLTVKFEDTFRDTKIVLMNFLSKYNHPDSSLDNEFIEAFNKLIEALVGRINFEEETLYTKLSKK